MFLIFSSHQLRIDTKMSPQLCRFFLLCIVASIVHFYFGSFTDQCQLKAYTVDYICDNMRFWFSAHNCQVPTPTSQNLGLEQEIRIFGAD